MPVSPPALVSIAQPISDLAILQGAASSGNPEAQAKLGTMLFLGQGLPMDRPEALKWFMLAAKQNQPYAQAVVGLCYAKGDTLDQNLEEAYYWLFKAALNGSTSAIPLLMQVQQDISPREREKAIKRILASLDPASPN